MKNFWKKAAVAAVIIGLASAAYFHFAPAAPDARSEAQYCICAEQDVPTKNKKDIKSQPGALWGAVLTAAQTVLVLAVSLCVKIVGGLAALVFTEALSGPLHLLLTFLTDVCAFFILLLLLSGLIYKKMYPERSLRSFYTKRNMLYMLLAAAALAAAKTAARFFMHRLRIFAVAVQCVLSLVTIAFLWYKVYGMRGGAKEAVRAVLTSKQGRLLTAGLAVWTLLSAAVKIWIEKSAALRAGADIAAVFLMCAGIWYGVHKVRQFRRRPLDSWAAQDV